jgi:hypothetical protein
LLESIHFLLTYTCNFECDHCFLWCGPGAGGTFRIEQICAVLDQAVELGTIKGVCFEGGEPMLFYPLMLEGIREAKRRGLSGGIVTNAYWATSVEDAKLWLRPLLEVGVKSITMSDDSLHYGDARGSHKERVETAAKELGMSAGTICTERPSVQAGGDGQGPKVAGGVMFRGRAAAKLTGELPRRGWETMGRCPHEKLDDPSRVHVDCYGNVHLCQGLVMGNLWQTPLKQMVAEYRPQAHEVVGPLLRGGPAELVRQYGLAHEAGYVDECHLCYEARRALLERCPEALGPRQVYGVPAAP